MLHIAEKINKIYLFISSKIFKKLRVIFAIKQKYTSTIFLFICLQIICYLSFRKITKNTIDFYLF